MIAHEQIHEILSQSIIFHIRGGSFDVFMEQDALRNRKQFIRRQILNRLDAISTPRNINIIIGSYNVNNSFPAGDLSEWLPAEKVARADIVVIGLQEMDLGTDSFMGTSTQSIPYEESKEYQWLSALSSTLGDNFECVVLKRLVGMCIFLFTKKDLREEIKQLASCSMATGLMGVLGNKGAVALRFRLFNQKYIFVCSHLAAHVQNYARRNYEFSDIVRRLSFPFIPNDLNATMEEDVLGDDITTDIEDCDFCFWFGDLNYRIDLESGFVRKCVYEKCFEELHIADQLCKARTEGSAFADYEEAPVLFPPTFKYNLGSDIYDTSEKFRTPSWTDRILWRRSDKVAPVAYWCAMDMRESDHRPVALLTTVKSSKMDSEKLQKVYEEALKMIDVMENAAIPDTWLSENHIDVGLLYFAAQKDFQVILRNEGTTVANFEFIKGLRDRISHSWITPHPLRGTLLPSTHIINGFVGSEHVINLSINVIAESAYEFNRGAAVEDILILHIEGGRDHFISLTGEFRPSVFSRPLTELPLTEDNLVSPFQALLDVLRTMTSTKLQFFEMGDPLLGEKIIEMLDCGSRLAFDLCYSPECIVITVSQVLIMFLDALTEPLLPTEYYNDAIAVAYEGRAECQILIQKLPEPNRSMLLALIEYLQRHVAACRFQGQELTFLTRVLSSVIIKRKDNYRLSEESTNKLKAKSKFIKQLINAQVNKE